MEQIFVKDRLRLEHFGDVGDPREGAKVKYPPPEVLFLVTCASIAGCDDYDEIALRGEHHLAFLRKHSEYFFGTPKEDWLRVVPNRIDRTLFEASSAFADGAVIRLANGFWLAIPTPAAGTGARGKRMNPGLWAQMHGQPLRFIYRRGTARAMARRRAWPWASGPVMNFWLIICIRSLMTLSVKERKASAPLFDPVAMLAKKLSIPWLRANVLAQAFGDELDRVGLGEFVFHGLRKTTAVVLAEAGCSTKQIAAVTGQSDQMVEHYSRMADRAKLAKAAVTKLERKMKAEAAKLPTSSIETANHKPK